MNISRSLSLLALSLFFVAYLLGEVNAICVRFKEDKAVVFFVVACLSLVNKVCN